MEGKKETDNGDQQDKAGTTADVPLDSPDEVKIEYLPEPPRAPEGKKIHRRRPLPPIPEGKDEPDQEPSPPEGIK